MKVTRTRVDAKRIEESLAFLEQVSWLMESKRARLDIPLLRKILIENLNKPATTRSLSPSIQKLADTYAIKNPDKHYLVGSLPELLQDSKLFPSNKDIAEFAKHFLNVSVSRYEKRSRYEMIGLVVCRVNRLGAASMRRLASRLSRLVGDDVLLSKITKEKAQNSLFSWNNVIRQLAK